jgi:DNA-binding transcriptional ArsR family regulator
MVIPLKKVKRRGTDKGTGAPFAYDGLDRVIHEHARLSVLTSLVTHVQGLTFSELKQLCALTDGNLSRHLQVLEDAGLVTIFKGVEHNRPITLCRITAQGRRRYIDYLSVLERVLTDAETAVNGHSSVAPPPPTGDKATPA